MLRTRWAAVVVALFAVCLAVAGCGGDDKAETAAANTTAAQDLGLKTPGKLVVGSDMPYAPFEFTEPGSDEPTGFDVDLVKAIAATFGVTDVTFKKERFDTIFSSTAQKRFDMAASSITITDERKKTVLFGDPYFEANQSLMVRTDDQKGLDAFTGKTITPEEAQKALEGKVIAVQRGTTGAELAAKVQNAEIKQFQIIDDAFNALAAGKADVVVNDYAISAYATTKKEALTMTAKISPSESYGFAFAKDNTKLADAFNAGLAKVKEDGTYATLYKKWFNEEPPAN